MLAWIMTTSPFSQLRDSQTAVRLAKHAVEQRPQNGLFWTTLGVAHYRLGEWKSAIEPEKSAKLSVHDDVASWLFLAMARWQAGDKTKARSWYDKAVQGMEEKKSTSEDECVDWNATPSRVDGMGKNKSKSEELLRFRTRPRPSWA